MALSRRTGTRFQSSIWPGFVDAMTGLLLVLMFVLTIFMVVQFVLTERISGQETELNSLANEVAALAAALGLQESENNQLQSRLGTLNTTLDEAQEEANEQAVLIATLTFERDTQAAALRTAQSQIFDFETQVAALLAQRDDALGQVTNLEGERAELLSAQEALNLALSEARSEIDEGVEAARLAATRREALEALITDLRARNADAEAQVATLSGQVAEAAEALSAEETARLAEAAAAEALRARLENADAELTAMTLELERQRKDAEDTLTLLAAARAAEATLDTELTAALLSLQSAQGVAQAGAEAQSQTQKALAAAEDLIADLQAELEGTKSALEAAQSTLSVTERTLLADRDGLRLELDAARAEVGELRAAQAALKQTVAALSATETSLNTNRDALETALAEARGRVATLEAMLAQTEETLGAEKADLQDALQVAQARLDKMQADLEASQADLEATRTTLDTDREGLRASLSEALAAKLAAEALANDQTTDAQKKAALLAAAQEALAGEQATSAEAQRQAELLNQQVAALRTELGSLRALLDDAKARDVAKDVQLQSLGSELNTALARVAAEKTRLAELEAAERKRLEEEAKELQAQAKDLEQYRSEFFGRLRDVLGAQEGVRIEGDRFVFSSEVLFPPGGAVLSADGQGEIAKVANILRSVVDDIPSEIDWVIRVDGHTDNVPLSGTGAFADNWELSQARALSVVKYMISALQIPPDRLAANGFGQYQPIAVGDSDAARAQNRRIELKFTEK